MADEVTGQQAAQAAPFVEATLDLSGVSRWLSAVPQAFEAEIAATLEEIGVFGERVAAEEAPEGALGASGGLRGSVFHALHGMPVRELVVGWAVPYAEYVDRGRRPGGMPPTAPIALWVRKVLGASEEQSLSIAFAIARKIGQRGTRGNPFVLRTQLRVEQMAVQIMERREEALAQRLSQ